MAKIFHGTIVGREGMPAGMTQLTRQELRPIRFAEALEPSIPKRGAIIGTWSKGASDPFAEAIIVRDDDFADTLAWLASYFVALSPVTQWCRVLRFSQALQIEQRNREVTLGSRLGAWIGAILGECSIQLGTTVALRDLPGTAALSSATFAAGRAVAVWGNEIDLREVATRHDEMTSRFRDGGRRISANHLIPLWGAIESRETYVDGNDHGESLYPLIQIFDKASERSWNADTPEALAELADEISSFRQLPALRYCARGPQSERVRALDSIAEHLVHEKPITTTASGLLGFAASLVDPGAAVLPDLLRKYSQVAPLAPIWLGAFAGMWSPVRVLSDHQGLGRLVSKALLAEADLEMRPTSDAAFDEIARWLPAPSKSQAIHLRGMAARTLSVEVSIGVTAPFPFVRSTLPQERESTRVEASVDYRSRANVNTPLSDVYQVVNSISQRLDRLERRLSHTSSDEPRLNLPEPEGTHIKKPRGSPRSRK